MSFLDRVTKAVSETVDRGKKEVDQFMRIQKVKGEIGDAEKAIDEARGRIQQIKLRLADALLDQLRAGEVSASQLAPFGSEIEAVEQEIATRQTFIAEKKAEVERIKAEDETQRAATTSQPAPTPPVPPPTPTATTASMPPTPVVPPPLPVPPVAPTAAAAAQRLCRQCGHAVADTAAFCGECGTPLT